MDDREQRWMQLMRAGLAGDQPSYERLLREITPAIRSVVERRIRQIGAPAGESEDVVQETLLAVHLKRHTWRVGDPLGPWLRTIARNKLIDQLRRRGRRAEVPVEDFAELLAAPEPRPGAEADDVERHLALLPDRQRSVIRSIAVEGASVAETAEAMQMTAGAVRVTLHRAFARLAARLKADEQGTTT